MRKIRCLKSCMLTLRIWDHCFRLGGFPGNSGFHGNGIYTSDKTSTLQTEKTEIPDFTDIYIIIIIIIIIIAIYNNNIVIIIIIIL